MLTVRPKRIKPKRNNTAKPVTLISKCFAGYH